MTSELTRTARTALIATLLLGGCARLGFSDGAAGSVADGAVANADLATDGGADRRSAAADQRPGADRGVDQARAADAAALGDVSPAPDHSVADLGAQDAPGTLPDAAALDGDPPLICASDWAAWSCTPKAGNCGATCGAYVINCGASGCTCTNPKVPVTNPCLPVSGSGCTRCELVFAAGCCAGI